MKEIIINTTINGSKLTALAKTGGKPDAFPAGQRVLGCQMRL